jgi:hypothetical protein
MTLALIIAALTLLPSDDVAVDQLFLRSVSEMCILNEPTKRSNALSALTTTAFVQKGHVMAAANATDSFIPSQDELREVPGYPGYFASADGRIWSNKRPGYGKSTGPLKPLVGFVNKGGYHLVLLRRENRPRKISVHLLMLETFVGPRPEGKVGRHLDDDKSNNAIDNLAWGTPVENYADRDANNKTARGSRQGLAKLSERDVTLIKRLLSCGVPCRTIARAFDCAENSIGDIKCGRTWRHVLA